MGRHDEFYAPWGKARSANDVQGSKQSATCVRGVIQDKRPITARSEPLKFLFLAAACPLIRFKGHERHAFIAFSFEKCAQKWSKIGARGAQPDKQNGLGAIG